MEGKELFGILINLIVWPLLIYYFFKNRSESQKQSKNIEAYNRPLSQFAQESKKLQLTLSHFGSRGFYPYVLEPSYDARQKAVLPKSAAERIDHYYVFDSKEIRKGKSESKLYFRLLEKLGNDYFLKGDYSVNGFYPDILYVNGKEKIFLDIEIDEPYVLNTDEPIHYCQILTDENGKKYLDDPNQERDGVFRQNGWAVIRFSEQQVLNHCDTCCNIVEYVINYFQLKGNELDPEIVESIRSKRWTEEEAEQMALGKTRS